MWAAHKCLFFWYLGFTPVRSAVYRKHWASSLREVSKVTRSLPKHKLLAMARQSCEHRSCSCKFSWSWIHIFCGDQTGKHAGWSSLKLILCFPGGLQQSASTPWGVFLFLFPWKEEIWLSMAAERCCHHPKCCGCLRFDGVSTLTSESHESAALNRTCQDWPCRRFPPLGRVRQMLVRRSSVCSLKQNLAALCWRGRETFLPNTKWRGSKVSKIIFSFPQFTWWQHFEGQEHLETSL